MKHAGIAGVLAAGVAPAVRAQAAIRWRLASSFPKSLPTIFGSAEKFAETVKQLSGGKFDVSVHAGGELMPAFGVVDAIQNSTVEMAQTAPYYFTGKDSIFAFGCAVPFGLTARQMDAWMEHGNGRKLMDEFYAKYNIVSMSAGNTTTQMGGWYRKEIKSVADLKGLKMRMGGGLFGEAMAKLGVVAQNMPAGEVYQALEKGTLDATEFVGPFDDEKLGFNKVAPFYYYPGWWEGGAELEFFINKKAFEALSAENKAIVRAAGAVAARDMTAKYDAVNPPALKRLVAAGTKLKPFPKAVMDAGFKASMEVFAEHEAKSPEFKKIHQDMRAFQRDQILWSRFSEYYYDGYMTTVKI
jgi:TRAP-type mannitol/chloroaromatic compound transport system substrate-binding protein